MFRFCTRLVGGKGTTYDENHVDKAYAHIDGGTSNPGYFTALTNDYQAYACYTESDSTLTFYYDRLRNGRSGTTYDLNTGNEPGWRTDGTCSLVTNVVFNSLFANARPTTTYHWFCDMENLETITGMQYLNTSHVTDMWGMFDQCSSLTCLDVSNFNTSDVTCMRYMFRGCSGLTSLSVSNFNTANVTDMGDMFSDCGGLTSLDLSNFNTAKVTNMENMFWGCEALTSLNLSSFNTANVTNMHMMFDYCRSLTSLDLSTFNTANVTDMGRMFDVCDKLRTIYVGSCWTTESVTISDNMFRFCTRLVGGKGTTYDENHVDKAYAHIDGGTSNPGYFTSGRLKGDVNGDGDIDVSDVTMMISCILNDTPVDLAVADMDNDDVVDVSDVTLLIAYILNN